MQGLENNVLCVPADAIRCRRVPELSLVAITVMLVTVLAACDPIADPSLSPMAGSPVTEIPEVTPLKPSSLRNLYWGDLHIHTALSSDAFAMGCVRCRRMSTVSPGV